MCDKCAKLDKKIEHYETILVSIGDRATVERLMAMIADLQAQKAALHPEKKQKAASVASFITQNLGTLCRQPDGNLSSERPLLLLPWDGIGRSVMVVFERICVASALTGFLVLVGTTIALFVAA